ncbi:shikimate dehydrogenase [Telmatospirillum sp.]|uniref:shikimate dehydrogenase n=1 Tax=Telmatospirillum sp. TaxID=2079197 RepID=UPI0028423C35|nr:shikimate dehydrogenase [Telmatospirillum sp.]MDR3439341.1 shikimate dehydrogenase [Telmatospirillum sp.]
MTDKYALIGSPIYHSKSPMIHGEFARSCEQDITYTTIETSHEDFSRTIFRFRESGGRGMNVTAPFKVTAMDLATERCKRAELAGAANTLKFVDGNIVADNFDGVGLVRDIESNLGIKLSGRRVLILGAGGAARGAIQPCLERAPCELMIANRTIAKAVALATAASALGRVVGCSDSALAGERFDVIINATSASLRNEQPAVPACVFTPDSLAYDLVYGKGLTPFLAMARSLGVKHLADGCGMLVEQAAEAFLWWRGVRPDTRCLIKKLKTPLL